VENNRDKNKEAEEDDLDNKPNDNDIFPELQFASRLSA
jgi:hypothetical protein